MKICPKCNTEHSKDGVFCSRACANSRTHSIETKLKIGNSLEGRKGHSKNKGAIRVPRITSTCEECGIMIIDRKLKKYCSNKCSRLNSGGYREGSGRAKTGYYKGIYCGSTYELVWVIYNIDHKIQFERFESKLTNGILTYYPDFIIENTIYEMKGFEDIEKVNSKSELAKSLGYNIVVLFKDDLEYCFEWVKNNYQFKELQELYDGHKPKYNLICGNCKLTFGTDNKSRLNKVENFCSQKCSGQFRTHNRK